VGGGTVTVTDVGTGGPETGKKKGCWGKERVKREPGGHASRFSHPGVGPRATYRVGEVPAEEASHGRRESARCEKKKRGRTEKKDQTGKPGPPGVE